MSELNDEMLEALRRGSGIAIRADGRITWRGAPLQNEKVEALFWKGIELRDDGEVILRVGAMWCYVRAEDVPFFADRVEGLAAGTTPRLVLKSGEVVNINFEHLVWAPPERLYALLEDGRRVRLLREATRDISQFLQESEQGELVWEFGGVRQPARRIDISQGSSK